MATKTGSSTPEPHESWPDRIRWAEEQGLKSLQEKSSTADAMAKEAQTTLTYIVSGMGATFAYVFSNLDHPASPLISTAAMLCVYFTLLGAMLVWKAFFVTSFPSPYQQPKNLIEQPEESLDSYRLGELDNIDKRIIDSVQWINAKAKVINRVRAGLVASPVVGALLILATGNWPK